MIYYFSGTGNSEWAAKTIAEKTGDTALSIREASPDFPGGEAVGLVFPVYAWDAPHLVYSFLETLKIPDGIYTYAVCTCGDEAGNLAQKLSKKIRLDAVFSIVMPNNYVVAWDVDDSGTMRRKLEGAKIRTEEIARAVRERRCVTEVRKGGFAALKSTVISPLFNRFAMGDRAFFAEDGCVSCGNCQKDCPVGNIKMKDGKPSWNGHCIKCMSCINRCPAAAIQYGKGTKSRGRYYFHETQR